MKSKNTILRHTDKSILVSGHYKTDEKLVLRKEYNKFFEPKTDIVKDIIEFVFSVSPKNVLDVGCGNGDFLIKLRKAGFSGKLTGLEISSGMLEGGIKQNSNENLGIDFIVGDAEKLPYEDNSFDVIIAKHMLYHLPNIQKGVDEMYRCLKKGGVLVITLNGKNNNPLLHECEKMVCKKYNFKTLHGRDMINTESTPAYLEKFASYSTKTYYGKMNRPDLFSEYFKTFIDNYFPQPSEEQWAQILLDVEEFIQNKIKETGAFNEERYTGLIIAKK